MTNIMKRSVFITTVVIAVLSMLFSGMLASVGTDTMHSSSDTGMVYAETRAGGGRFALAAVDSQGIVIEPCFVSYNKGETIKQALMNSGHEFFDLENDWIYTVDGHTDNYMRYYDNGAYNLNAPASDVATAFFITTAELTDATNNIALVKVLAEHPEKDEKMKKYGPVKKAYEAAVEALPTANPAKAKTLTDDLNAAYAKYEAWQGQTKCKVTIKPMQNGRNVSAKIKVTDTMDNVYEMEGSSCEFQLLEESYHFSIMKDCHEVSGDFDVSATDRTKSLSPVLPHGNWIGSIAIRDADGENAETVTSGDTTTSYIQDTTYSPFFKIIEGEDIPKKSDGTFDSDTYSVYSEYTSFAMGTYYGDESLSYNRIPWESSGKRLVQAAEAGLEDKEIRIKVVHPDTATGYVQRQYHNLVLHKIPTLKGLMVKAGSTKLDITPEFTVRGTTYQVDTIKDKVSITGYSYYHGSDADEYAECGKYKDGYSVEVNGASQPEDGAVEVTSGGEPVQVKVRGTNGLSSICTVQVNKVSSRKVTVSRPSKTIGVTLETSTGSVLEPDETTDTQAIFYVGPGTYSWVTTMDEYYHASGTVEVGNSDVTVQGVTPVKEQLITSLGTYSGQNNNAFVYEEADGKTFRWDDHEYNYKLSDFATTVYAACEFGKSVTVTREPYVKYDGSIRERGTLKTGKRDNITKLIKQGNRNNSFVIRAARTDGSIKYYQDYKISTRRFATLDDMAVYDKAGNKLSIYANGDEFDAEFDSDINMYTLKVGRTSEEIHVICAFSNPTMDTSVLGDQTIKLGGKTYERSESENVISEDIALDPNLSEEIVKISLSDDNPENPGNEYQIRVIKVPAVKVDFNLTPNNTNLFITDDISGVHVAPESDGSYRLLKGFKYTYYATCYGYVGQSGKINVSDDETITLTLPKAAENTDIDTSITAEWPYFRADDNNNGVISHPVPNNSDDTVMYWAKQIGEGYSAGAAGCPIMADGYIYTYSRNKIVKLDAMTGEIVKEGEMVTGSAFAINSPTYAEGMIFVGLNNGVVQAFNAKTLESLWVYTDALGGQPNCQITYKNGYLYTGFWNSETRAANFACLTVTDEDPGRLKEEKLPVWTYTGNGFYWAGACVSDDHVIIGSDDGDAGYQKSCGVLLSLDPHTGVVLDQIDDTFKGDIRSSICYDTVSDRYYFTSKSGLFCSVKVNKDGTFKRDSITKLQLLDSNRQNGMSTSTPVVYNGRAYVGVSGSGTYSQYTGHNITVIDLEGTRPVIAYNVETQGYPQTSGLLTTAYEGSKQAAYVYFFDNYTPGKLRVIKDKPGQTAPDPETIDKEEYEENGIPKTCNAASAVFSPYGDHAQYAICSPIADEWGNIYFKNDSAYMMKIGAKITKLEVTKQPDKKDYLIGSIFDPTGMKVTATYANGKTRDVTDYVKYTTDPLTLDDTEIQIIFDLGENMNMYQNKNGQPGVKYFPPEATVSIRVTDGSFVPDKLTSVTLSSSVLEYTGQEQHPEIASINGLTTLREGIDYDVAWPASSVNEGKYTVTVTGKGNYTGSVSAQYEIKKTAQPTQIKSLTLTPTEFIFNGSNQRPEIGLINGTDKLEEGKDYTVVWPAKSVDIGTYSVTVTGIGNYTGSATATYTIKKADTLIEFTSLELSQTVFYFNGERQRPSIKRINGIEDLQESVDYTVAWPQESTDTGTYTVSVTGKGRFTGTVTATYVIDEPREEGKIYEVKLTNTELQYTGLKVKPEIDKVNGDYELEEGTDYKVEWPENPVNVGEYTVTVTGIGEYSGSATAKYKIIPQKLKYLSLKSYSFTYSGKKQIPLIGSINDSTLLTLGKDYDVKWPDNPENAGTYTVTVTGKGNYSGDVSEQYVIAKAANKVTVKPAKKTIKIKKKVQIKISAKGGAKITVKVTKGGKSIKLIRKGKKYYVQGKKRGKAVITVTAAATKNFKKATKKINITVKKK